MVIRSVKPEHHIVNVSIITGLRYLIQYIIIYVNSYNQQFFEINFLSDGAGVTFNNIIIYIQVSTRE